MLFNLIRVSSASAVSLKSVIKLLEASNILTLEPDASSFVMLLLAHSRDTTILEELSKLSLNINSEILLLEQIVQLNYYH